MMQKTLDQMIGQLIIAGFRDNGISNNSEIKKIIENYNVSGVILYDEDIKKGSSGSRNIISPKQLKDLTSSLQEITSIPLFISIDQEGGNVNRLKAEYGFPEFPSWRHIGILDNKMMTTQFSNSLAETMKEIGVNLNFAPVLDLDYGKETYIGKLERAVSSNPKKVVEHSKIFIDKLKEYKIISCGKHFPGQGSASGDTHESFTDISDSWSVADMIPYADLIESGHLDMIMVSHVFNHKFDHEFPSSLSFETITNGIRNDLNFDGVIICDDPSMKAISNNYSFEKVFALMINAGIDLFCLGNNLNYEKEYISKAIQAISANVRNGVISEEKIKISANRIDRLKKKFGFYE